jgi:hypothetical protein
LIRLSQLTSAPGRSGALVLAALEISRAAGYDTPDLHAAAAPPSGMTTQHCTVFRHFT